MMKNFLITSLIFIWIISGLVGHDPWKPDEAYSFGLVYHMLQTGDWVVPTLAEEPFMEKPPLYYIVASLLTPLFSPYLPLHDAARLTSGFFMSIVFLFLALSARNLYGKGNGYYAILILMGCFGLLIRSHQLITDVALLTGFSIGIYGLTLSIRHPYSAGIFLGTGTGIGFLSKGLIAPGLLGFCALSLPLLASCWRTRDYFKVLLIAFISTLPWFLIWPSQLYIRSPDLFDEWFWLNNIGRFIGFAKLGPEAERFFYFKTLLWYALPALPLAILLIWKKRHTLNPEILMPLSIFCVMFLILSVASDARELYAMPMLLPLSLLATAAFQENLNTHWLSRSAKWFFGSLSFILWSGWLVLWTGFPEIFAEYLHQLQPGFVENFRPWQVFCAICATGIWISLSRWCDTSQREHTLWIWTGGLTSVWVLITSLWMPFLNAGNSYIPMIHGLKAALPSSYHCISSQDFGEPQRALLEYVAGIVTYRQESFSRQRPCDIFLLQSTVKAHIHPLGNWHEIWSGHRVGDNKEIFRLYKRM